MYERHFGITGPPFQLSPDPFFYFDSPSHHAALAALRQVFSLESPFVIMSGEIGAGKTTLLRVWLAELEAAGIVVAQLANTQLDADELMCAVATAFGVRDSRGTREGLMADLRRFLQGLNGRAALLVIDEAQNLDCAALRCLLDLADRAVAQNAVLRICLAGQPELRAHLAAAELPDLPSRMQPPAHLGPLEAQQARQYIEHRLLKVGWAGTPAFDAAAFEEIHRHTGGVPRRINVLSNRLMLSQFLAGSMRIDAATVLAVVRELEVEVGATLTVPARAPLQSAFDRLQLAPPARGALWLVASGRSDHVKALPLLCAIGQRRDLPPPALVSLTDGSPWQLDHDLHAFAGVAQQPIVLADVDVQPVPAQTEAHFQRLVEQCRPEAVIVFDGDSVSQCCARIAREQGVALVHVGADAQGADERLDPGSARASIARLAGLRFDCQAARQDDDFTSAALSRGVGNLLSDAVYLALQQIAQVPQGARPRLAEHGHERDPPVYGVVALKQQAAGAPSPCGDEIVAMLREVSRDLPLVWPMRRFSMLALYGSGLARTLKSDRISCIDELAHADFVHLLCDASCVLTDCLDVLEEAATLGVPCLSLGARHAHHVDTGGWLPGIEVGASVTGAARAVWQILFQGSAPKSPPALWDGHAATRIAAHLAQWLADRHAS
ncbi:MAG: AAA family ATPase [Burkholderiaceae bacterium]